MVLELEGERLTDWRFREPAPGDDAVLAEPPPPAGGGASSNPMVRPCVSPR